MPGNDENTGERCLRPKHSAWPACCAVKTRQKAADLQLLQTETHRSRVKGKATGKNSMRSGAHSKVPGQKAIWNFVLITKKEISFLVTKVCVTGTSRGVISDGQLLCWQVEVLTNQKQECTHQQHTNRWMAESHTTQEGNQFKSRPNSVSGLKNKWSPSSTPVHSQGWTPDLKLYSLQNHSHLVPKNEQQQSGQGTGRPLSTHWLCPTPRKGGKGLGGSVPSSRWRGSNEGGIWEHLQSSI